MKKTLLVIFAAMLCCNSFAQRVLDLGIDKKILYADSLDMPEATTLSELLTLFPELQQRNSASLLDNYEIKIEGQPVGDEKDAIFSQIRLADIMKIEVDESPMSNYLNKGQGGSINIVLRSLHDGFSGVGSFEGAYPYNTIPGFRLNYHKDKLSVRSFFTGEYYSSEDEKSDKHTVSQTGTQLLGSKKQYTTDVNTYRQMARVYIVYDFTPRDVLKINLSESYTKQHSEMEMKSGSLARTQLNDNKNRDISSLAKINFKHTFATGGNFQVEAVYTNTPGRSEMNNDETDERYVCDEKGNQQIAGKVELQQPVLAATSANTLKFTTGVNTNYTIEDHESKLHMETLSGALDTRDRSFYLAPFFKADAAFGPVTLLVKVEYQYLKFRLVQNNGTGNSLGDNLGQPEYNSSHGNFLGQCAVSWAIHKDHKLRLSYNRQLKRPGNTNVYPYLVYEPAKDGLVLGNADLKSMLLDVIGIDYNASFGNQVWSLLFSVGGKYTHTKDNIVSVTERYKNTEYNYTTYSNGPSTDIYNANAMVHLRAGRFSVNGSGNFYTNKTADSRYRYHVLHLSPSYNFPCNWQAYASVTHFSKVKTANGKIDPTTTLGVQVSKKWNGFLVYVYSNVSFNSIVNEENYVGENIEIVSKKPFRNTFGLGVRYDF